jgi:hypothetical protein
MKKADERRQLWIDETQMFQRIAKVAVTPADELGAEWDKFNKRQRDFNVQHIQTHQIIQDAAVKVGKSRNS